MPNLRSATALLQRNPSMTRYDFVLPGLLGMLVACASANPVGTVSPGTDASVPFPDAPNSDTGAAGCSAACQSPFQCSDGWTPAAPQGCWTTHLGAPACAGTPASSPLQLGTVLDRPTHWMLGACIAVSYADNVASLAPALQRAVGTWNAQSCNRLCFGAPSMTSTRPNLEARERRVHFRLANSGELASPLQFASVTTYAEGSSGRIYSAEALIGGTRLAELGDGDVLSLLVGAAGFNAQLQPEQRSPTGLHSRHAPLPTPGRRHRRRMRRLRKPSPLR